MKTLTMSCISVVFIGIAASTGFAQSNAEQGARNGADTGAAVLGPIGALVGSVTGAAVGGAADLANATAPLPPTTVKRTTCVTDVAGNRRCDSIETTN